MDNIWIFEWSARYENPLPKKNSCCHVLEPRRKILFIDSACLSCPAHAYKFWYYLLPEAIGCFPNQDFQDLINHHWWLWNCLLAQLQWYLLPPYSYSTHYFSPYPPSSFSTQTPCYFLCRHQWFLFLNTFTGTIHIDGFWLVI